MPTEASFPSRTSQPSTLRVVIEVKRFFAQHSKLIARKFKNNPNGIRASWLIRQMMARSACPSLVGLYPVYPWLARRLTLQERRRALYKACKSLVARPPASPPRSRELAAAAREVGIGPHAADELMHVSAPSKDCNFLFRPTGFGSVEPFATRVATVSRNEQHRVPREELRQAVLAGVLHDRIMYGKMSKPDAELAVKLQQQLTQDADRKACDAISDFMYRRALIAYDPDVKD